jgi:hypothetical protein
MNTQALRHLRGAKAQRFHEIFLQRLAWMRDGQHFILLAHTQSMIVHNLDLGWALLGPPKTNPPLVVDADAVLAGTGAFQRFQRWGATRQICVPPRSEQPSGARPQCLEYPCFGPRTSSFPMAEDKKRAAGSHQQPLIIWIRS